MSRTFRKNKDHGHASKLSRKQKQELRKIRRNKVQRFTTGHNPVVDAVENSLDRPREL